LRKKVLIGAIYISGEYLVHKELLELADESFYKPFMQE